MSVITETEERTTRNPVGFAAGLAGPSVGSKQVSTWRVLMEPGVESKPHEVDKDQVWMPVAGAFAFNFEGQTFEVAAGQAIVVPAGAVRTFRAVDVQSQALVAMAVGGTVAVVGADERKPLAWAE